MTESPPYRFRTPDRSRLAVWLIVALLVIGAGWTLRIMAPVVIPVIFACLAVLAVSPLDLRMRRLLPEALAWVAHLFSVLLILLVILAFIATIGYAAQQVLAEMPRLSERVSSFWSDSRAGASGNGTEGFAASLKRIWSEAGGSLTNWAIDGATTIARASVALTGAFLTSTLLILFIAFMALSELGDWRTKFSSLWSPKSQSAWIEGLQGLSLRLRQFLLIRTVVGLLQAALYVAWLALFGVDLLLVWGVLTFVLTYIPTLGSVIAGTLPIVFALMTHDPLTVLGIAAGILVIEQVVGNYVDPVLLGQRLVISPLVILISLLFWGWYWGVAGAFLATPLTLTFLVLCNRIPPLRPVALLLSNQPSEDALDTALRR